MFRNYLKIAWRSLVKNKFYSLLNIGGLAVGFAAAVLLLLWVYNEKSYDRFHPEPEKIFNLSARMESSGSQAFFTALPGVLASYAAKMPDIERYVRTLHMNDQLIAVAGTKKILDGNEVMFADSAFFSVFHFPFAYGNAKNLLNNMSSVAITEKLAKKLFGTANVVGKSIGYQDGSFKITGVLKDVPENSSLQFDMLLSMMCYGKKFADRGGNGEWKTIDQDYGNFTFRTYVKLNSAADPEQVAQKISADFQKGREAYDMQNKIKIDIQNIKDWHLITSYGNTEALKTVRIFMLIAILLLSVASINYINLSTARSLVRVKEVSMRKIVGAERKQLFFQFITETVLMFVLALCMAAVMVLLLMPLYNFITEINLAVHLADKNIWFVLTAAALLVLLASAVYPALLLSSFHPMQMLRKEIKKGIGMNLFRKILVVFQFTVSVLLIISTLIIGKQMNYINTKDLGYDKSYVFSVPLTPGVVDNIDAVKNELSTAPGILSVAASNAYDFTGVGMFTGDIEWQGKAKDNAMMIGEINIDTAFINTMKIKMLEGSGFTGEPADSAYYILNETAVKEMGLKAPYIGQSITLHNDRGTILGVVKDFNFQSLKSKVSPLILYSHGYKSRNILFVRTNAINAQTAIAATERQYKKYAGANIPFAYNFLDKQFDEKYKTDRKTGLLFAIFAGIAIFISCLGLLGLAAYAAQVRTKEIGIRKVLGASVSNITSMLSKDFLKPVFLAFLIAIPIAWWLMHKWLQGFAYKTELSWIVFVLAGIIVFFIALLTVSFQTIRAARANPVKSLKTE